MGAVSTCVKTCAKRSFRTALFAPMVFPPEAISNAAIVLTFSSEWTSGTSPVETYSITRNGLDAPMGSILETTSVTVLLGLTLASGDILTVSYDGQGLVKYGRMDVERFTSMPVLDSI